MATTTNAVVSSAAKVAPTTVERAVSALLKWKESQSENKNPKLIPDDDFIYLILTLKKIPEKARTNAFKIPLPTPLHTSSSSELCLIIDDRPKSNLTKAIAKEFVKDQSIPVSKIIPLSKLKTDYKPFEAKRKLCDSYDLFLVDKSIVHFLPKLLGKHFFKKKKLPVPVDLTKKNWGKQVEKACGAGLLYMKTGTCCVVKVGKLAMDKEEIVNNVAEGIQGVVNVVPKNWGGVRSLHLKFADSVALPLYQALPDLKLKIEGLKSVEDMSGSEVVVKGESGDEGKDGNSKRKKKGRIHEVRYMDVGIDGEELVSDDDEVMKSEESAGDESSGKANVSKKRKKGNLVKKGAEVSEEEIEEKEDVVKVTKKAKLVKSAKGGKKVEEVSKEKEDVVKKTKISTGKKADETEGGKEKKGGALPQKGGDMSGGMKGKRKSELVTKVNDKSVKARDTRSKKRVAAA